MHFDTLSIHGGRPDDQIGSVMSPIHVTTTFERDEAGNLGGKGYVYTRWDNPNRRQLETGHRSGNGIAQNAIDSPYLAAIPILNI